MRECVQALAFVLAMARAGKLEGVWIMWWPVGAKGDPLQASWIMAGRTERWPNDAHAGAGRLMRSLTEKRE
jgi:hypothetical protein